MLLKKKTFSLNIFSFFCREDGIQGRSKGTVKDQKTERLKKDMSRMDKDEQWS